MLNPLQKVTGRPLNALITIASTCGFVLFGYDNGVFSGLIINPWFLQTFNHPNASLLGTVSAMYNIGGFAGSLAAFFMGNPLGRRRTILLGIAVTAVGTIPFCTATTIGALLAGRIVCGIGVGLMTSTVGLWQAETTPARTRGAYLVAQLIFGAAIGLFLAQWINFGFSGSKGRVAFVFPVAFQLVFLLISGVLILGLPESPRWLAKKDRNDEALTVLERLTNLEDAQQRMEAILKAGSLEKGTPGTRRSALFRQGSTQNFRRLCLACGVMVMHQLGGVNSVTYYLPTLLQKFVGTSHRETLWIAGLSSVMCIICGLVPILTIDRVGRKPYLMYASIFQAVMFVIIAVLLGTTPPKNKAYGAAAVVMLFVYYGGNAASWLGVSWAYPAEILPLQIREQGLAMANVFYWLFQFMFVEVTPIAIENIYWKFYVILAVFNCCNAAVLWAFYPETARKSLEEIDFYFAEKYRGELSRGVVGTEGGDINWVKVSPGDNKA